MENLLRVFDLSPLFFLETYDIKSHSTVHSDPFEHFLYKSDNAADWKTFYVFKGTNNFLQLYNQ